MEERTQSLSKPVKVGLIIGVLYCVLIYCQDQFFYGNPLQFASTKLFCYLIILAGIFVAGYLRKKELGGYITFQEALRTMLLVIAILELFYVIFSTVYIEYINPHFFDNMRTAWQDFFTRNGVSSENLKVRMDEFKDAGKITIGGLIKSYGFSIIIDSVFAVVFALILKKNPPVTEY